MRGTNMFGRLMIYAAVGALIIIGVGVAVYFATKKGAETSSQAIIKQAKANELVPVTTTGANGKSTTVYRVPPSRVPLTAQGQLSAASDTLIPSDWASDPQNVNGSGPNSDPVTIPAHQRTAIAKTISSFLAQWETFMPPATTADADSNLAAYQQRLAPFANPGDLGDLVSRVDNHQPPYICPDINCGVGSVWEPNDQSAAMVVRSWSATNAYVTTYGAVRYRSRVPQGYSVVGYSYARSYGIVLSNINNHWVVDRAAATTTGPLN
jgi:hypothetical protein